MMFEHHATEITMRTTIDIESDVLAAAKEIARQQRTSVGKVISELVRQTLTGATTAHAATRNAPAVPGFEPFPARGIIVTNELIDRLRDAEGV
jgi:Arc/MetJ family transcription regulator